MATYNKLPYICVDWDGTAHPYKSGWQGAAVIAEEGLTEGFLPFLREATAYFTVAIYSSRSHQEGGIAAMQAYLQRHMLGDDRKVYDLIEWPTFKPPAVVSIDDRAIPFAGLWPDIEVIRNFKPWNKA